MSGCLIVGAICFPVVAAFSSLIGIFIVGIDDYITKNRLKKQRAKAAKKQKAKQTNQNKKPLFNWRQQ